MVTSLERRRRWIGILWMSGIVLIVVALVSVKNYLEGREKLRDPETLCWRDRAPTGCTVMLIDKTDPFDEKDIRLLEQRIQGLRDSLGTDELLAVYVLNGGLATAIERRFCLCNPGTGAIANIWIQNARMVQARWDSAFGAPLDKALAVLATAEHSPTSPILEAIALLSREDVFRNTPRNRRLVVISDFIQNTNQLNQYADNLPFSDVAGSEYGRRVIPDLSGASVRLEYVTRPGFEAVQTRWHQDFWMEFFHAAKADSVVLQVIGDRKIAHSTFLDTIQGTPAVTRLSQPTPWRPSSTAAASSDQRAAAVAEEEPAEEPPAAETIPDPARAPEPRSAAAVAGNWSGDFEGKAFSLELSAPVPSSDGRWSLTGHGSVELSSGARRFPVNGNFERDSISLRGEAFLFKGRLDPKDLSSMSGVAMTTTGQPRPWRLVRR